MLKLKKMCRHVLNAQVFVQANCCGGWFDCAECHDEVHDHPFQTVRILRLNCKTCRRVFQKDIGMFLESDKFCEGCNTSWSIPGVTPESIIYEESKDHTHNLLLSVLQDAERK